MQVPELMDKAIKNAGLASDYALAKRLGFTKAAVSKWRNELSAPDPEGALKLADLAGEEPFKAIAVCEMARYRDPEKISFWRKVASGENWRKW